MERTEYYERNILALSARHSLVSEKIHNLLLVKSDKKHFDIQYSKTGYPVPCIIDNERPYPLCSRFDPEKEAEKLTSHYKKSGMLIFLGFGGGYQIQPFLRHNEISAIVIVEKDPAVFLEMLYCKDFTEMFLDRRVFILLNRTIPEVEQDLLALFLPVITGDLTTVPLPAAIRFEREYYEEVIQAIKKTAETVKEDYSVQCYFGKRWFNNTLFNLPKAQQISHTLPSAKRVYITAAGPSLELYYDELKKDRDKVFLIATDTSLPALLSQDIMPDLVISIDCQHISYHHFLKGYPREIPLLLDLASPPQLTEISDKLYFFTSGHPLSTYINHNFRKFPEIDTSGGNVTHAAVSLAVALNASEIRIFGADFSYPEGKPYVRGSYIYHFFQSRSSRLESLTSQTIHFIFRNPVLKDWGSNFLRYTSSPMVRYKAYLENLAKNQQLPLSAAPGKGLPLSLPEISVKQKNSLLTIFGSGKADSSWKDFLIKYQNEICQLPELKTPLIHYFDQLKPDQKVLWSTLLPTAAQFMRITNNSHQALTLSKDWSLDRLSKVLSLGF